MANVDGPRLLLAKMWCKSHFFVLKTCCIISHSLTPDFHGVICFLLCSYFCNVTMLLHLLLYVFGLHILSACVVLFSFFSFPFSATCV